MKKILSSTIFHCILIFIAIYAYNSFLESSYDHIIDFTHCLSLANGLKIYKDFNIVIGPIYPIIISFFMIIFGRNLLVFNIINSLFVVLIYLIIRKNNENTLSLLVIILLQNVLIAKYNTFTLLFFYIIYYLEKKDYKYQDYLIGFLLSLLLFTKINVGVFLIIPTFFLYFKDIKKIAKRAISFIITSFIIILTMACTNILNEFINYTLLGLIDFNSSTSSIFGTHQINILLIIVLITAFLLILFNIKKHPELIYMLCYLIMAYPIFDSTHIMLCVLPTIIFFVDKLPINETSKYFCNVTCLVFSLLVLSTIDFKGSIIDCKNKYCSQNKDFNTQFEHIHTVNKVLNKDEYKEYKKFYINYDAYFYKLDLKENINKYDFVWEGNMGYNGENKYINDIHKICKNNKCMFIIEKNNYYKHKAGENISYKLLEYIINEYEEDESIPIPYDKISIYTNKKSES